VYLKQVNIRNKLICLFRFFYIFILYFCVVLPSGPLLNRHDDIQKCPLYPDVTLTLTCAEAIKYVNISRWTWQRDPSAEPIPGQHTAQLTVTEAGKYTCSYWKNTKGGKDLLTFRVKEATRKALKVKAMDRDWAFCRYSQ
jgi:hypothetical protein